MQTPFTATVVNRRTGSVTIYKNVRYVGSQALDYYDETDTIVGVDLPQNEFLITAVGNVGKVTHENAPFYEDIEGTWYNAAYWRLPRAVIYNHSTGELHIMPYMQEVYCWKLNSAPGRPLGYQVRGFDESGLYHAIQCDCENFSLYITAPLRYPPIA